MLSLLKSKKANISIIALLIINILLFNIVYVKSYMGELKLYSKYNIEETPLFVLENLLVTMIYEDYNDIFLKVKDLSITSKISKVNENTQIEIDVLYHKQAYKYYAIYDTECIRVLDFYLQEKSKL